MSQNKYGRAAQCKVCGSPTKGTRRLCGKHSPQRATQDHRDKDASKTAKSDR
jgi:hypothetical protein